MQQISGERLQDHWTIGPLVSSFNYALLKAKFENLVCKIPRISKSIRARAFLLSYPELYSFSELVNLKILRARYLKKYLS